MVGFAASYATPGRRRRDSGLPVIRVIRVIKFIPVEWLRCATFVSSIGVIIRLIGVYLTRRLTV
jgi:hypothetical protein